MKIGGFFLEPLHVVLCDVFIEGRLQVRDTSAFRRKLDLNNILGKVLFFASLHIADYI